MPQKTVNTALGLHSFKNELSLEDGALIEANNIIIDRDGVIEPRRGFKLYSDSFGTTTDRAKQLLQYKDRILIHYLDKLLFDDGTGNFSEFSGTFTELDNGLRIKSAESNGNFYFTTKEGIRVISALDASEFTTNNGYIRRSGIPKGLDIEITLTTSSTWLEVDKMTAYRVLWAKKDINNNLLLGSPGQISVIRNDLGGAVDSSTLLKFTIPNEIIENYNITGKNDYLYQIYRDVLKDSETGGIQNVPEDEMNLVFEDYPTTIDFTNGYVEIEDIVPESFREAGTTLYTNPISGDGINSSNDRPPLAKDITKYQNHLFYANTSTIHRLFFNILAVDDWYNEVLEYADLASFPLFGSYNKIYKALDTSIYYIWNGTSYEVTIYDTPTQIYIGDETGYETYEASTVENIANKKFLLATTGTPAQNIDDTSNSLIKIINRNSSSRIYSFYMSGSNDLPGQILLEKKIMENINFYIGTNIEISGNDCSPKIPIVTPATPFSSSFSSDNEINPNRIYYSKVEQPEAVPILNYITVGSKDKPILRIIALRESLFILKTDGIYRLSGTTSDNFVITLTDSSSPLIAADTAQVLNNQIYMLTSQGIVTVTDGGVSIISRKIEDLILKPTSSNYSNFSKYAFGIAYESDRAYLLFLPTLTSDTTATQCFRFNVFTRTWTRWIMSKKCGIINLGDDKLYLGPSDINQIEIERKNFERTDYADREYEKTLAPSTIKGNIIYPNNILNINKHDVLYQIQYITIVRFNRLLKQLDKDWMLNDKDYYDELFISTGENLGTRLQALIVKIELDDTLQIYTSYSGSNDIEDIRDGFNTLIDELNTSIGIAFTNYEKYTTLISYESVIQNVQTNLGKVTLYNEIPILIGDCIIFNGINTETQFSAEDLGDPSLMKQFRESTLLFDQFNFTYGIMSFRTDVSNHLEGIEFEAEGNGDYGTQTYGEYVYGGDGGERPFRTFVPRNKQRCRYIYIKFTHDVAREKFSIIGYSLTYNEQVTPRAYRS